MNAPPFPTDPSVGEWFGNWVWNGARWVCSPSSAIRVITKTFTASGPYMPSPGLVSAVPECIGAGGGGGGALGDAVGTTGGWIMGGGGGGAGGYSRIALAAALVAGGVNVTIGAGGAGGLGGGAPATAGGATSFGALCVANGGQPGDNALAGTSAGVGGAGGAPGVGDVAARGSGGGSSTDLYFTPDVTPGGIALGGQGAASYLGGAGVNAAAEAGGSGDGGAGLQGAGGDGGVSGGAGLPGNGGQGGSGYVIVTEYCFASGAEDDCLNPPINVNARVAVTQVPWPGPGPCPPGWGQVGYDYEGDG